MTKVGERVELIHTNDPHTKLKPGTRGTVSFIDDMGTVHVNWDDGGRLGLIEADGDRWVVVAPAQMSEAPTLPQ